MANRSTTQPYSWQAITRDADPVSDGWTNENINVSTGLPGIDTLVAGVDYTFGQDVLVAVPGGSVLRLRTDAAITFSGSLSDVSVNEGDAVSVNAASGLTAGTNVVYSLRGSASFLAINASSGAITGTAGAVGGYTVTVDASNAAGTVSRAFTLTVAAAPEPGVFAPVSDGALLTSSNSWINDASPYYLDQFREIVSGGTVETNISLWYASSPIQRLSTRDVYVTGPIGEYTATDAFIALPLGGTDIFVTHDSHSTVNGSLADALTDWMDLAGDNGAQIVAYVSGYAPTLSVSAETASAHSDYAAYIADSRARAGGHRALWATATGATKLTTAAVRYVPFGEAVVRVWDAITAGSDPVAGATPAELDIAHVMLRTADEVLYGYTAPDSHPSHLAFWLQAVLLTSVLMRVDVRDYDLPYVAAAEGWDSRTYSAATLAWLRAVAHDVVINEPRSDYAGVNDWRIETTGDAVRLQRPAPMATPPSPESYTIRPAAGGAGTASAGSLPRTWTGLAAGEYVVEAGERVSSPFLVVGTPAITVVGAVPARKVLGGDAALTLTLPVGSTTGDVMFLGLNGTTALTSNATNDTLRPWGTDAETTLPNAVGLAREVYALTSPANHLTGARWGTYGVDASPTELAGVFDGILHTIGALLVLRGVDATGAVKSAIGYTEATADTSVVLPAMTNSGEAVVLDLVVTYSTGSGRVLVNTYYGWTPLSIAGNGGGRYKIVSGNVPAERLAVDIGTGLSNNALRAVRYLIPAA